ncbi:MAG: ketose-bisphosphate aldolase [Sphaerochaetaceae bacterium]
MALVTLKYVMRKSMREGYAVGAFNFFGLENLQGIVLGAANKQSPVIAMASTGALTHMGEKTVVGMAYGMSQEYGVPLVLHLDHATDYQMICRCIDNGFTSVMIDASAKSFAENVDITAKVVEYAAKTGCSVEAELGHVGGKEDDISADERTALFTRPEDVVAFVSQTGIDALAIAVGTVHGFYKSTPKLDFERIAAIRAASDIPLVLHGGTGVPDPDFRRAIALGVNKINVGTELRVHGFFDVMKKGCNEATDDDPRKITAMIRKTCARLVEEKIEVFGSTGKAC